jgi:hypothetical protein
MARDLGIHYDTARHGTRELIVAGCLEVSVPATSSRPAAYRLLGLPDDRIDSPDGGPNDRIDLHGDSPNDRIDLPPSEEIREEEIREKRTERQEAPPSSRTSCVPRKQKATPPALKTKTPETKTPPAKKTPERRFPPAKKTATPATPKKKNYSLVFQTRDGLWSPPQELVAQLKAQYPAIDVPRELQVAADKWKQEPRRWSRWTSSQMPGCVRGWVSKKESFRRKDLGLAWVLPRTPVRKKPALVYLPGTLFRNPDADDDLPDEDGYAPDPATAEVDALEASG